MEFKNALNDTDSQTDESRLPPPPYVADTTTTNNDNQNSDASIQRYWSTRRIWLHDLTLHILSAIFAIPVIVLYVVDLCYAQDYKTNHSHSTPPNSTHSNLTPALIVIDALGIASGALPWIYCSVWLRIISPRARKRTLSRKWSTAIDVLLWALALGMADTTLAMRTSKNNCSMFDADGGCLHWRRMMMIAVGVLGILLS